MDALTLNLSSVINLTDEQFFQLCQEHELIRFERNPDGTLVLMPLRGGLTSSINANFTGQLGQWNRNQTLGVAFASSVGFTLPNGAVYSPNLSWLKREKWDILTPEEREKFPPVCPDFVAELRDSQDCLQRLQKKMQHYLNNGTLLGWLIDLETQKIEIYRQNQEVRVLESPTTLSGEDVLPGFILNLQEIW